MQAASIATANGTGAINQSTEKNSSIYLLKLRPIYEKCIKKDKSTLYMKLTPFLIRSPTTDILVK